MKENSGAAGVAAAAGGVELASGGATVPSRDSNDGAALEDTCAGFSSVLFAAGAGGAPQEND